MHISLTILSYIRYKHVTDESKRRNTVSYMNIKESVNRAVKGSYGFGHNFTNNLIGGPSTTHFEGNFKG